MREVNGRVAAQTEVTFSAPAIIDLNFPVREERRRRKMTAVEPVVSFLVQKLGDLLIQEAIFLHGVRDQVEWIKGELAWMQGFLKDADAKEERDERVKTWVRNVRNLAFDAEDVVDTYVFKIKQRKRGVLCSITRFRFIFTKLVALHKLGSEMERIKTTIRSISERRSIYGIQNTGLEDGASSFDQRLPDWRQTSPHVEEPDLVGFKKDLETLVKQLTTGDRRRCVVSVVGMGGLGKTTLTRKVYNSEDVKKHFDSCTWICISQQYSLRDLLQKIINSCMELSEEEVKKVEKMNPAELSCKIFEHLKQRIYLIVLDDIWKTETWDALKDALPDSNNGSRILLTTRNTVVALHADPGKTPHELRFLSDDESWELFCKKAFFRGDTSYPEDLQNLGREIVRRCQGLPLAIVVIGGLLSRKEPREWEKVYKSISWQFVEGEVQISRILALSYKDLPSYLKPCFLYLGIFPEDYEFRAKKLIQLWAAEGFLRQRGDETPEEIGEDCLKELIQRSLIQVARRSSIGDIKSCRIHDLLRDLSISEASEDRFLEVHRGNANASSTSPSAARRLAIHHSISGALQDIDLCFLSRSTPRHRSVFLFSQKKDSLRMEQEKFLYKGFTLLRVLDLHGVAIKHLPNEIGELIHLRYLGCAETSLESLPSSIGDLLNLQTLYVTTSSVEIQIPSTIGKMHQLRHLQVKSTSGYLGWGWGVIQGHPQLNRISKLQTLLNVRAGNWMQGCLGELASLSELGICLYSSGGVCFEGASELIAKLDNLQSLFVSSGSPYSKIPVLVPFSHLLKLCQFRLEGRLRKLPEPSEWPTNLIKLTLKNTHSEHDPLIILEKLKSLRALKLGWRSYMGMLMACSAEGFPRLESLYLQELEEVQEWRVDKGAMPRLLHLRIKNCLQLKMLPEGLMHVTTLKKLELWEMSKKFNDRLHEGKGEDWLKIRRIPSINIKK